MRAHLIAVQARMTLADYRSAEVFAERVVTLGKQAVAGLDDAPKLIAFPETIGLPFYFAGVPQMETVGEAMQQLLVREWRQLVRLAWWHKRIGLELLYLPDAVRVYRAYRDAFSQAAVATGATIVAGTVFLPQIEEEASCGVHIADARVHNTAFTFSPQGRILDRTHKCYLTSGVESQAGLTRAPLDHLHAFDTPLGRVGVAICLDGFYSSVVERLDGAGACIVLQPSANHAPWGRPWPAEPSVTEGQAWLTRGLRAQLQGRTHLRYGVNPMMVGDILDLSARGRSSLLVNRAFDPQAQLHGLPGVLALAQSHDQEEIVRAEVELPNP